MNGDVEKMLAGLRDMKMTEAEKEEQRRSFAYGSAKIENEDITREMVDAAADRLMRRKADG
jgi:hypothetical protein